MTTLKKRLGVSLLACAMAAGGFAPTMAAPIYTPAPQVEHSDVVKVQYRHHRQHRRDFRRDRRHSRFEHRNGRYYYNGHRGYRTYHRGYRKYNGYWFPPAAFVMGAIVGGAVASSGPRTVSSAHVNWCRNHYRSYRVSDDTFQPYNGPRRRCSSPYN